jgi:hypothetical protein
MHGQSRGRRLWDTNNRGRFGGDIWATALRSQDGLQPATCSALHLTSETPAGGTGVSGIGESTGDGPDISQSRL